jgi:Glycosyl transferases group 1
VAASAAPRPLRVAFVGQSVYFRQCALERPAEGVEPGFLDFRAGAPAEPLMAELAERDPDIVLVFRPEIIPAGLFQQMRALTIGYLTEPLPRERRAKEHHDLRQRMWWLERVDPANFDRIISFDPLIAETASSVLPVWRSLPIPVADSIYREVRVRAQPPRLLFVGRPTEHRERLLAPLKRSHRIVHIGHGLYGERLLRFFERADVQLNLHNNPYPTFENRMLLALAAGHLVISEPLSPDHGLEPGGHFLEAHTPEDLRALVEGIVADPERHAEVRRAGREAAERFRASRVYPGLLREALEDVAENGGRGGDGAGTP